MTVPALTFTRDFVEGWAQLVDSLDIGLTWRADLAYQSGETGMWPMSLPVDTPSRAVAISPYPLTADPALAQSEIGLQFRIRTAGHDVRDAWTLDDALQNALLGLYPATLPTGIHIEALRWSSGGSMGQDAAQRWEWATNFATRVHRPSTHRQ